MDAEEARRRIRAVQNGSGLDRDNVPEGMRGEVARGLWQNSIFSYGMEYGYLLAMLDVIGGKDSTA